MKLFTGSLYLNVIGGTNPVVFSDGTPEWVVRKIQEPWSNLVLK